MEPSRDAEDDDLRPEYDLSQLKGGVRGKYAHRKRPEVPHGDGYETTGGLPAPESNGTLTPDEIRAFQQRMLAALQPIVVKSVVPITYSRNGSLGIRGTGTLFRVANKSFLVTASHVVDDAEKQGFELAICDLAASPTPLPLHGRIQSHGHRAYDVAIWELPLDVVDALPNRTFITVHHADRENRRPPRGWCCVLGFPESFASADLEKNKLTVNPPFTFGAETYEGATNSLGDYDPRLHILLHTPPEGARCEVDGPPPIPTRLNGMSGCSIWQAYYEGLLSKHWTPDDAVVVAVQTGVYKNGTIVKGTRWWVVDQIIRKCYPELAGPLSLVVPTA